jgi:hypothetical protein
VLDPDPILARAFGVPADAFIVRLTLVPAVMALLARPHGGCRSGSIASSRTSTPRARD